MDVCVFCNITSAYEFVSSHGPEVRILMDTVVACFKEISGSAWKDEVPQGVDLPGEYKSGNVFDRVVPDSESSASIMASSRLPDISIFRYFLRIPVWVNLLSLLYRLAFITNRWRVMVAYIYRL
jgi:hypothetical protein